VFTNKYKNQLKKRSLKLAVTLITIIRRVYCNYQEVGLGGMRIQNKDSHLFGANGCINNVVRR
jgi:hypothetical protein